MTTRLARFQCRSLVRIPGLRLAALVYVVGFGVGTLMQVPVPFLDTTAGAGTPALDVAWWLWAVMTPWWVSRLRSVERGDAFVALNAQLGVRPGQALLAQLVAAFVFAGELALLSMPIGALAYASGRATPADVLSGAVGLAALASLSIIVTFHCGLGRAGRLASWLAASAITLAVAVGFSSFAATVGSGTAVVVLAAVAIAGAVVLPLRARRELLYQVA
jgi:hypothetical protein